MTDNAWTQPNNNWTKTSRRMHRRRSSAVYKWDLKLTDVLHRQIKSIEDIREAYDNMVDSLQQAINCDNYLA